MPLRTEAPRVGPDDLQRSILSPQSVVGGHGASWGTAAYFQQPVKQLGWEEKGSQMLELESPCVKLSEWPLALLAQPEAHIPKPFLDVVCELTQTEGLGTTGRFACSDCVWIGRNSVA